MASLPEYNALPPARKKAYLDSLSADERNALLAQMKNVTRSPYAKLRPPPLSLSPVDDDAGFVSPPPAPAVAASSPAPAVPSFLPSSSPWTRNEMSTLIIFTLLFPLAAFAFFIASQQREGTRKQGFTILTVGFIMMLITVVLAILISSMPAVDPGY